MTENVTELPRTRKYRNGVTRQGMGLNAKTTPLFPYGIFRKRYDFQYRHINDLLASLILLRNHIHNTNIYLYIYICIYLYICVCVYIYINIYI